MGGINNAINSQLTQYNTLCGGANNTIANISPGSSGQILTSNGVSAAPTYQTLPPPSFVKILTQTASSSSTIAFSSTYITNTYKTYFLQFNDVVCSSGSGSYLTLKLGTSGGLLSSGYTSGMFSMLNNSTTITNSNSSSLIYCAGVTFNLPSSGNIYFYNLQTSNVPIVIGQSFSGTLYFQKFIGYNSTTSITNISFAFDTGNIASGTFSLYGLVQ